jgi:hypothetical protein
MGSLLEFTTSPTGYDALDYERLPTLRQSRDLLFPYAGLLYEGSLDVKLSRDLDLRVLQRQAVPQNVSLRHFVNTAFYMSIHQASKEVSLVLTNFPNLLRTGSKDPAPGRCCDLWWFSSERHTLYAISLQQRNQHGSGPPWCNGSYVGRPVGMLTAVFPLIPACVAEIAPPVLCRRLSELRAQPCLGAQEIDLLEYMKFPREDDVTALVSLSDWLDLDICFLEASLESLWAWARVERYPYHLLFRRECMGAPPMIDAAVLLLSLVRLKDMGIDPRRNVADILLACLDVVLDGCPPAWATAVKKDAVPCPKARRLFLTLEGFRFVLASVPLPLRQAMGLAGGASPQQGYQTWMTHGVNSKVRNTKFTRMVLKASGKDSLDDLTWVDLKMYETFGGADAPRPDLGQDSISADEGDAAVRAARVEPTDVEASEPTGAPETRPAAPVLGELREKGDPDQGNLQALITASNEHARDLRKERRRGGALAMPLQGKARAAKKSGKTSEGEEQSANHKKDRRLHGVNLRKAGSDLEAKELFAKTARPVYDALLKKAPDDADLEEWGCKSTGGGREKDGPSASRRSRKKALLREVKLQQRVRVAEYFDCL